MNIEEITSRITAAGGALLPHQRRAIESEADVVILSGESATGKSFTVTLGPAIAWLERLVIEYVFGQKPPASWNAQYRPTYRDVLTIKGVASVHVLSLHGKRWRGWKWSSVFIDAAERYDTDIDVVAGVIDGATRAIITTYNGTGTALALRARHVERSSEIVRIEATANAVNVSRALSGVLRGAA